MDTQNGTTRGGVAIVTGGSRGLGRNMVRSIAGRGTDVIFTYQSNSAAADELVAEVEGIGRRAAALQLDVGDAGTFGAFADQVRGVLQDWGTDRFQFLVNNAGIGIYATIAETTEEQFDRLMGIHVKGPFFLTQKLLPLMADGGRIVNVSTGLARFVTPGFAAYASAKGAVEVMTRYLAAELGPRGIAVNVIAPGAIETDFGGGVVRDNPDMNEMVASHTALGRAGLPEDIGGVVASLLSPEMGWVNAQRVEASGGQNL
jgi:NAD(P)-dependent dehydrogenase (short-subunit alcohol dehydrogenase family)